MGLASVRPKGVALLLPDFPHLVLYHLRETGLSLLEFTSPLSLSHTERQTDSLKGPPSSLFTQPINIPHEALLSHSTSPMSPLSLSSPLLSFSPFSQAGFTDRKMSTSPAILFVCREIGSSRSRFRGGVSIQGNGLNFLNGNSQIMLRPMVFRPGLNRRRNLRPSASWISTSQIASQAFTWGTVAVLPFYTLMVLAPNSKLTRRSMESSAPYVFLGILYAYLLYLSWSPETLKCMFASKYWLPELHGIARMFSNEMTVASAWIHLLAVDLFAARQVFHDGLRNNVETRHSISLCLLFCPIGVIVHVITKVLTNSVKHQH